MGNKCYSVSGEEYYRKIIYKRYLNSADLNEKYQYRSKVYFKKKGVKTIQVYDMIFSKIRVMKQVSSATHKSYI